MKRDPPTTFIGSDKPLIIFYKFGPIRGGGKQKAHV